MIKHVGYDVTFQEVPNETSLCFPISNCQNHCAGCHSPELAEDIGDDLESDFLPIIARYRDSITCVCLLGEGNDEDALKRVLYLIRHHFPSLKICLYSGNPNGFPSFAITDHLVDYIKAGEYDYRLGGLSSPHTNQRMYKVSYENDGIHLVNITRFFQMKKE